MPSKQLSSLNPISESQFQSTVIELAKLNGYHLIYHTHDSRRSQAGWPDLVLVNVRRRRLLIRELKTSTGTVSAAQLEWLSALNAVQVNAGVWRPEDLKNGHIINDLRGNA